MIDTEDALVTEGERTLKRAAYLISNAIPKPHQGGWLADAAMNWDVLYNSAEPPGAESPDVAKRHTRSSKQRDWKRHRAQRHNDFVRMFGEPEAA